MACAEHPRFYGAGCTGCQYQSRTYKAKRTAAINAGTWRPPQSVAPAQAHVHALIAAGMSRRDIAAAARVALVTVHEIARADHPIIHGPTADAILAVRPAPSAATLRRGAVDPTGTVRMVRAATVVGVSYPMLAAMSDTSEKALCRIANRPNLWVLEDTAKRIQAAYEDIRRQWHTAGRPQVVPGGVPRIATIATRKGWHGPDAWDDDTIADPNVEPYTDLPTPRHPRDYDAANVHLAIAGAAARTDLTVAELIETVTILAARQWPDRRIADWLDWHGADATPSAPAVCAFRYRHHIPAGYDPYQAQDQRRHLQPAA